MRVAPHGVVTVNRRFADLMSRYAHRHPPTNITTNHQLTLKIESQLQPFVSIPLNQITDSTIAPYLKSLPNYQLTPEFCC